MGTVVAYHNEKDVRVRIANGHIVACIIAGKLIKRKISVTIGDEVAIRICEYDWNKGHIEKRIK